jgi:TDG/mug DNA glycosylase family protein
MLPDYLGPNLRAVICGVAASKRSGELGRYYAGPGNRFWPVLFKAGMVRTPMQVGDESKLLAQGIGLTDIAKGVSGMDYQIDPSAFCPDRVREIFTRIKPQAIGFNSKRAAAEFLGIPTGRLAYGAMQVPDLPPLWVLPSTSGAARGFWDAGIWCDFARSLPPPPVLPVSDA